MNQIKDLVGFSTAPNHYSGEREVIDLIRDSMTDEQFIGFCYGNYLKYISRQDKKDNPEQDAKKAEWYLQMVAHLKDLSPDPRATRSNFIPYARQSAKTINELNGVTIVK